MKKYNNILVVLVALLALAGCKEKMRELNTNQDLISDTRVQYMFTTAQSIDPQFGETEPGQLQILMQQIVDYNRETDSNIRSYRNPTQDNDIAVQYTNSYYSYLFSSSGNRYQNIIDYIEQQIDEDQQDLYNDIKWICKATLALKQFRVLENFGATVYGEAFKAISEGITDPHYEYMPDLYKEIDEIIAQAVKELDKPMVDNAQGLGNNDFFTGWKSVKKEGLRGVVVSQNVNWSQQRLQWKRYFNMIRLENAFRCEGRLSEVGLSFDQIFNECASYSNGYFESVDGGFFYYTTIGSGQSDGNIYITPHYCVSQNFINLLAKDNDPRLPLLARPNGATRLTSSTFAMMQDYFPDTLAKYYFLDGKHPYIGLHANPAKKNEAFEKNGFLSNGLISFNDLKNPMGTKQFKIKYPWITAETGLSSSDSVEFCPEGHDTFNCSILVGCEVQYRYFILCAGKNNANHDYSGNGIKGLGEAYKYELQADGDACTNGDAAKDLHFRPTIYSYPRQCFVLSMIGKTFAGKTKEQWYEEGMRASFECLQDEAHRMAIQAYTGGDQFASYDRRYPSQLTQVLPNGEEVTYNYPYSYTQEQIDAYVAAHPYSKENLIDQFYIYSYQDPFPFWDIWRKTGIPEFKEHATRAEADAEQHIYLEQPYSGTQKMTMIRRNCLPDRNTINKNYAEAKEYLQNDPKNPKFGQWVETDGYIWWESANGYPTGWSWE